MAKDKAPYRPGADLFGLSPGMYAAHFYREERGAPGTYENDVALRSGHIEYGTVGERWISRELAGF